MHANVEKCRGSRVSIGSFIDIDEMEEEIKLDPRKELNDVGRHIIEESIEMLLGNRTNENRDKLMVTVDECVNKHGNKKESWADMAKKEHNQERDSLVMAAPQVEVGEEGKDGKNKGDDGKGNWKLVQSRKSRLSKGTSKSSPVKKKQ